MNLPSWIAAIAYAGMGILIVVIGLIWWWVPKWQVNRLRFQIRDAKGRADLEDNIRKTLGQLLGGVAVLMGAAFAYYETQQTLEETRLSRQASQEQSKNLLLSQQVSKGFEQLGSNILPIRLGGIYALEGVMNNSTSYHRPIVEALCAFIRERTTGVVVDTVPIDVQATITVLGRRAKGAGDFLDLRGTQLPRAVLDGANLAGALLSDADLTQAILTGTDLSGALLLGAKLTSANLIDANLTGAVLQDVRLDGADLSGAKVTDGQLTSACGSSNTRSLYKLKECPKLTGPCHADEGGDRPDRLRRYCSE